MDKEMIDELLDEYDCSVYTNDKFKKIISLNEFELDICETIEDFYHNYNVIDTDREDIWNGDVRKLSNFSIEENILRL